MSKVYRRRQSPEHEAQCAVVNWAFYASAEHPELHLLFAVPNGARVRPAVAKKLLAEGMRKGVPDLILPVARAPYHGLAIEMKAPKGVLKPEQRWWRDALQGHHYCWVLCRSAADGIEALRSYLGIPRESFLAGVAEEVLTA